MIFDTLMYLLHYLLYVLYFTIVIRPFYNSEGALASFIIITYVFSPGLLRVFMRKRADRIRLPFCQSIVFYLSIGFILFSVPAIAMFPACLEMWWLLVPMPLAGACLFLIPFLFNTHMRDNIAPLKWRKP